ncbi:MAG: glycosyltransferase [Myxococcales bacterium]
MRLFVTVGNAPQPFDRLVGLVDEAIDRSGLDCTGVFQLGTATSRPRHLDAARILSRPEFEAALASADAVICHAGVGTIFSALRAGHRPIVVPRRHALGEHVNDHQTEIVAALAEAGRIHAAHTADELVSALHAVASGGRSVADLQTARSAALAAIAPALSSAASPKPRQFLLRLLAALGPPLDELRLR